MVSNLAEYRSTATHKGFDGKPQYFAIGDYLTYFASERRCYSRRVNEWLTVYTAIDNDDLVGVKVKGLSILMKTVDAALFEVEDGKVALGVLILAAGFKSDEPDTKQDVQRALEKVGKAPVPKEVLPLATTAVTAPSLAG